MSKRYYYNVLILVAFLSACNKETAFDCVKKTGEVVKEERYFTKYTKVVVEDNIDLVLVEELSDKVIIEAGENLLPKIEITQEGNVLTIENENSCNWVRTYEIPIRVYVGANHVKSIKQNGYGEITTDGVINTDTLRFEALTFGDVKLHIHSSYIGFIADEKVTVTLKGSSNKLDCMVFSNAQVDVSGVVVPWAFVQISSLLDVKAYADVLLQSTIKGKGNLLCYGNPSNVEFTQQTGKGTLKLMP